MRGKSHMVGGVALGAIVLKHFPLEATTFMGSILIGSLLPDIDHQHSKMGRWVRPFKLGEHRTVTHSLLFNVGVFGMTRLTDVPGVYWGMTVGVLSHLLLDVCNPTGIPWFYPWNKKKYSVMDVRTGSEVEVLFMTCVVIGTILYLYPPAIKYIIEILTG